MIKKLFVLLSVFLLSVGICLLSACEKEELLSLDYEEGVSVQFVDPCGDFFVNTSSGFKTDYNGVTYMMAKTLTEEERNRTVTETVACFNILENRVGIPDVNYTVYVVDNYYVPYVDGTNLYFGYNNLKTAEFATGIVQLVYGRDVNYGVLYGLGASIASERGYKNSLTKINDALSLYETAPEYLDLNYACFLKNYADGLTLEKIKTVSIEFYQFLEKNGKTDLLSDYSDVKRRNYFNQFLAANGKGAYNASDLDGIAFFGGGNKVRLMWENESAKFVLYDDFKDYYQNGSLGKDPLNCGYADFRKHVVNFEAQMRYTRERLAAYNDVPNKMTAKFASNYKSEYIMSQQTLKLNSVFALKHEYTHAVLNSKYGFSSGINSAVIHSLVYYFERYPVDGQLSYGVQVEQDNIKNIYGFYDNAPKYFEFLDKFTEKLGHEINLFDLDDYVAFYHHYTQYSGIADKIGIEATGYADVSLGNYLVSQFGEADVCKAAFNNMPEQVLGKSWETILSDWRAYLDEKCIL